MMRLRAPRISPKRCMRGALQAKVSSLPGLHSHNCAAEARHKRPQIINHQLCRSHIGAIAHNSSETADDATGHELHTSATCGCIDKPCVTPSQR